MSQSIRLTDVRSHLAERVIAYLESLVDRLDRTPWHRNNAMIRASAVAVPVRVLKEKPPAVGPKDRQRPESELFGIDPEVAALYEEPTGREGRELVDWDREWATIHRAVVLGPPGGGKSFLAENTVVELASLALDQVRSRRGALDDLPIPVHLDAAQLASYPGDLRGALNASAWGQARPPGPLDDWIVAALEGRRPRGWLVIDALDQVEAKLRLSLRDRLEVLDSRYPSCRMVLTCRTANYDRSSIPWRQLVEYELAPFDPAEVGGLFGNWFGDGDARGLELWDVVRRSFSLGDACRNPLVATLTCLAHEEQPVTAGTRRVDLYARVLRGLVRRAWRDDPLDPHDPHIDDLVQFLQTIGLNLFEFRPEVNTS